MEYLEERYPEPALLPADPAARALERLRVLRFDDELGRDYYAFRRGDDNALAERLRRRSIRRAYGFAAIAYLPWILRARDMLGVELPRARRGVARRGLRAAGGARGARRRRGAVTIDVDELAARLDDPTLTVARRAHRRRVRRDARQRVRSAAGAHSGRAPPRRRRARAVRDGGAGARARRPRRRRRDRGVLPQRLALGARGAGPHAPPATTRRNYVGSWHEWSRRDDLPLETLTPPDTSGV